MDRYFTILLTAAVVAAAGCDDTEGAAADPDEAPETASELPARSEAAMEVTIGIDSLNGAPYLTGADGHALYLLEGESPGTSGCEDACRGRWPPFMVSGDSPEASASGVHSEMIGTMERREGGTQATYGGRALYYYHRDTGPGQTTGQGVTDQWGEWYLVQPSGEPLEHH